MALEYPGYDLGTAFCSKTTSLFKELSHSVDEFGGFFLKKTTKMSESISLDWLGITY